MYESPSIQAPANSRVTFAERLRMLRTAIYALLLSLGAAFSNYLVRQHCNDRQFEVDEVIMGEAVKRSGDYSITVYAADELIRNGSTSNLKNVKVAMSGKVYQVAIEVRCSACYFDGGSCEGKRRTTETNATLIIPKEEIVEIRALWGRVYGKVFLTESFVLFPQLEEDL